MRTTVDIDPHLLKRLRLEAHRRGVSFKDLLTTILQRGLQDRPGEARASSKLPTFSLGAPASSPTIDKALRVASELEDQETLRKLRLRK